MYNGLSKSLGMVLLAAAVLAAAGCTSPGNPNATSTSANSSSPSASASEAPAAPPGASPSAPAAGAKTAAPANTPTSSGEAQAPQAAPKPTFAPPEQRYLVSRVPQGTDPNAVLQVGQESCAQLENVKATDQKAVVSHLIEKVDAEVVAAIKHSVPGSSPSSMPRAAASPTATSPSVRQRPRKAVVQSPQVSTRHGIPLRTAHWWPTMQQAGRLRNRTVRRPSPSRPAPPASCRMDATPGWPHETAPLRLECCNHRL